MSWPLGGLAVVAKKQCYVVCGELQSGARVMWEKLISPCVVGVLSSKHPNNLVVVASYFLGVGGGCSIADA